MRTYPQGDLYRLLEVDPEASPEVIAAAYRVIAKRLHPDVSTSEDTTRRMAVVNAAYDVLRDPDERRMYDRERDKRRQAITMEAVVMTYGKHRGRPITEVPSDYLMWVIENLDNEGHIFDASQELVRRGMKL